MSNIISEEEQWEIVGYIEASTARKITIKTIGNEEYKLPSDIYKETDLTSSQVSKALNDLKSKSLVVCLNESYTKGKLYKCTNLGLEILKKLK